MDANSIGTIAALITAIAGLLVALTERRKKAADYAEQVSKAAAGLVAPQTERIECLENDVLELRQTVESQQKKIDNQARRIGNQQATITRQHEEITAMRDTISAQSETILILRGLLVEKDTQITDQNKVILSQESRILTLERELELVKASQKSTDKLKLKAPENGV